MSYDDDLAQALLQAEALICGIGDPVASPSGIFDAFDDLGDGFGYLGERSTRLQSEEPGIADPAAVAEVDTWLLDHAAEHRLTGTQLFEWANAKDGRFFADVVFGDDRGSIADRLANAERFHLTPNDFTPTAVDADTV